MPSLTKPRSLSKTLGIAAISLLAAGFITALGFGLRGLLWEMKKAQAELVAAQASIEVAKAQMLKAINDLEAAKLTANATVTAAQLQSQATVAGAEKMKEGAIGAATVTNIAEVSTTQNILNPYLSEPAGNIAKLQADLTRLDFELTKDTNITTGRPLTPEERQTRSEIRDRTKLQLEHAQQQMQNAAKAGMGIFGAYMGGMMELIKTGMKKNPGEVSPPAAADPVEYKRRSFSKEPNLDAPNPPQPKRINPEPFDASQKKDAPKPWDK